MNCAERYCYKRCFKCSEGSKGSRYYVQKRQNSYRACGPWEGTLTSLFSDDTHKLPSLWSPESSYLGTFIKQLFCS